MEKFNFGEKVVLTWSGGIDSTSLIPILIQEQGVEVFPIYVDWGITTKREIAVIRRYERIFRERYGNKLHDLFITDRCVIPPKNLQEFYTREQVSKKGLPLRNSNFANLAAIYAHAMDINTVIVGSNKTDRFPDNSLEFWTAKQVELRIALERPNFQILPLLKIIDFGKKESILYCYNLGIDLRYTWSCWGNAKQECGECPSCKSKMKAYQEAGI